MKSLVVNLTRKTSSANMVKKNLKQLGRFFNLSDAYVEVYLVHDAFMKKNVLSFPAPADFPRPDLKKYKSLGEIYLNPDYIVMSGEDLTYMLVHGFLHLIGYDHTIKREAEKMEAKEQELLQFLCNRAITFSD